MVTATGELDLAAGPQLRECLHNVINHGAKAVMLDINGVDFVDSTALGILVSAHKQLAELHRSLILVCSNEQTIRTLQLTALDRVFTIRGSIAEATD